MRPAFYSAEERAGTGRTGPRAELVLYAFIRTTVMLSPELMRAAKARAAERGETFKDLLTRAVRKELGVPKARDRRLASPADAP